MQEAEENFLIRCFQMLIIRVGFSHFRADLKMVMRKAIGQHIPYTCKQKKFNINRVGSYSRRLFCVAWNYHEDGIQSQNKVQC